MKTYCDYCEKEVECTVIQKEEVYSVKGEEITIIADVCVCPECGEELWVSEIDNANLIRAYRKYRNDHNLLQSEDIRAIREKYSMTQSAFARFLGFGEKTITRYENGSIQDEAHNNLMILISDAYNFQNLLELNRSKLSDIEYKKAQNAVQRLVILPETYYSYLNNMEYSVASLIDFSSKEVIAS